ncbi:MAG TPA: pantoate--beta-alanine ligase [Clostridia bacterium]|nr:pantoate--beta-alanine ligase [Clostridia bacterium]
MRILHTIADMQAACHELRLAGKRIGFVPTMGALHAGHMSLVKAARGQSDVVAVSIFVNPLQFGPSEDLAKYPRNFESDRQQLEAAGVALLFAPEASEMYPKDASTLVYVEGLSEKLDGASRPGHFRGVTTVVAKLFEIVRPERAFFGQKDAAQVAVIRKMVRDLNMDVQIIVCPIVREHDGLAMSSRNAYLSPKERQQGLVLYRALTRVQALADRGEHDSSRLVAAGQAVIADEPGARLDYFQIVDPDTLNPVTDVSHFALVAVAAWFGSTRLIDNLLLQTGSAAGGPSMAGEQGE